MSDEPVIYEQRGRVAVLLLNRPATRNAVNVDMAEAIVEQMARAAEESGAVVLTGADPAFCAGLDLRNLGTDRLGDLPPFVASVARSPIPVVAAVNGPAVTGGFELALACDFIIASERAMFADTHLRVGVYPGPVLVDLPRRVGMAWARQMSLTGDFVDAATALRIGVANELTAHEEVVDRALALAGSVAEVDPTMVAEMRHDWDETSALPLTDAHRVHLERAQRVYRGTATASGLVDRSESVFDRSRRQRTNPA